MGPGTTVTQADMDYDLQQKLLREIQDSHNTEVEKKEEEEEDKKDE